MDAITLTRDLLIILAAGLFAGLVSKALRAPTLVGYMLIGVLVGMGGFGLIREQTVEVEHLAELGVFLLLFAIGVEFSLDELIRLWRHLIVGGSAQMLLVAVPAGAVLYWLGHSWQTAMLLSAAVAFSSTVLVFKTLAEWGQTGSPTGRRMIGVLLFQDAALIPLLLMIPLLTPGVVPAGAIEYVRLGAISVGFMVAVVVLRWTLKRWVVPALAAYRSLELIVLATLVVLMGVTLASYKIGLPPAVGAFAAGLMFSGNRWSSQIDALLLPLRETFAAVFFVSLGMLLDPMVLISNPLLATFLFVGLVILKGAAATLALKLTGLNWKTAAGGGIGLAHVGEFAFVLVALSLENALITQEDGQMFVAVGLASLMLSPVLLKYGVQLTREEAEDQATEQNESMGDVPASVVVIGIGPVGARIATMLETLGRNVCLVDRSPLNLQPFAQSGFRTIAGDATEEKTLLHAGVAEAKDVVVCVPDDDTAHALLKQTRRLNQECRIVVRCRFQSYVKKLEDSGADLVISEEREAAGALERALM
jgi:CPA2 family monovalent cation:H+ antiporter-2